MDPTRTTKTRTPSHSAQLESRCRARVDSFALASRVAEVRESVESGDYVLEGNASSAVLKKIRHELLPDIVVAYISRYRTVGE